MPALLILFVLWLAFAEWSGLRRSAMETLLGGTSAPVAAAQSPAPRAGEAPATPEACRTAAARCIDRARLVAEDDAALRQDLIACQQQRAACIARVGQLVRAQRACHQRYRIVNEKALAYTGVGFLAIFIFMALVRLYRTGAEPWAPEVRAETRVERTLSFCMFASMILFVISAISAPVIFTLRHIVC